MKINYKRNLRKWTALAVAIAAFLIIHEGSHLVYALSIGAFKQINNLGFGLVQIEPYVERMSEIQLGIFCLLGPVSTIGCGYIFLALTPKLASLKNAYARAIGYYMTVVFLITDPLYLCCLSIFFGGGDMNGIILILPETVVRVAAGILALSNSMIIIRVVIPNYREAINSSER